MQNRLICIGYVGSKSAYLNITKDQAIKRFCEAHSILPSTEDGIRQYDKAMRIEEFEFDDEFEVYSAWTK